MISLTSSNFRTLEKSLDAAALRQKVIANNIANNDTPEFKASEVRFEEILRQQLEPATSQIQGYRTDPRHFIIGTPHDIQPVIVTNEKSVMNNNLNNVDIDREMTNLAENQLRYNVLVQQANHELSMIKMSIEGRR